MRVRFHIAAAAAVLALTPVLRPGPTGAGPVKVFILAGQSNMEGAGAVRGDIERNGGEGSLEYLVKNPKTADRFAYLVDGKGDWAVRDDVWIWTFDRKGNLTAGYGSREDRIGPELGFGHVVGDRYDEQVLLIKIAWGGKSLAVDFRPPSSGGEVGPCYTKLLDQVRDVLSHLQELFPEYHGQGYEIAGFAWHQGWNDRVNQAFNDEYEKNLANFIRDARKGLGIERLPFVIAETGMHGPEEKHPRALSLMRAQAAVAAYEEFKGNVAFVGTRNFYRPPEVSPSKQGYHWNGNAETYLLIGTGMGKAMIELIDGNEKATSPSDSARTERVAILERAQVRLRAIYERGELNARGFRGAWLPDSSGYTVSERDPGTGNRVAARYDVASGERTEIESPPDRRERGIVSPDGSRALTSQNGDLYVRELENGRTIRLTETAVPGEISNHHSVWSPDSKRIAFIESDSSRIPKRSFLVPGDPTYPEVRETRFARVGGAITGLRVGVVDSGGGEVRWMMIPSPPEGFYLGQVGWAGDSEELLVEWLSRFRNERDFFLARAATGEVGCIFREVDPAWVVASYGTNSGLRWIRGGKAFLVLSEKDGWRHAWICSREGKRQQLLTPGAFDIIKGGPIDEARNWYYFYASPENATQKYLYRIPLDGSGAMERVTPPDQPGTHDYNFSPDAKWAFHTFSAFDTPPVSELVHLPEHRSVRVLEKNAALRERAAEWIHHPTEFLQLDIGGVTMDAWMITPAQLDPSKKYPLFVHVYGEPHMQTVLDRWGHANAAYHRVIADLGYIVVSMDNRGTPAPKGAAWRRAVSGSLGPLSTEEQAEGVHALARLRPFVDTSRVGIWGWSGGGSNTLNAMFRRPDVYRVGIAVAPKPQPRLYNAWFQEIYMETPETNPEGYRRSAPINFAEGLGGDLLIIHGTGEMNTHIQITEGLVDRLIELGKPFDYMTYPNRDHGIRRGKGTTMHLRMLMVRYLVEHLPPGPR